MKPYRKADPSTIVIFGAAGDLTGRKLVPALYNLYLDEWLPEEFAIVGVDIKKISDRLIGTKGVKHGKLSLTTTGKNLG